MSNREEVTLDKENENNTKAEYVRMEGEPTAAFKGASWAALLIGVTAYLLGLFNATTMELNEKGYYFAVLVFGLYSAVSLQKRSEEHTSELQSRGHLVCRLLLEKK